MGERSCPMCGEDAASTATDCACGYRFATSTPPSEASVIPVKTAAAPMSWPTTAGSALAIVGAVVGLYAAFGFDPSVDGVEYGSRIVNTGLLQTQLMLFLAGLAAIICGVGLLGVGAIIEATASRRS